MAKQDYYEMLGVNQGANADEIKKAYRALAMKFHPDRNPGDTAAEQSFKEVSEAYEILKDKERRATYDRFGHAAFENGGGPRGAGAGGFNFTGGFADIFDEMFGDFTGGRRGQQGGRGADLRYNMQISLEDAYHGKSTQIRVPTSAACEACDGSGATAGSHPTTCGTCQGHGRVRAQQGFFSVERGCPTCRGAGQVIDDPCSECDGQGRTQKEKTLQVNIPQGVEDGTRIRLAGEGEAGLRGASPGDLYIFLSISGHELFHRDGANIYCQVPIPMTTVALGGAIEVPTIDGGRAKVTIGDGTRNDQQFRLRGKGMTTLHGKSRGDMYIQVQVETPVNLTKRQKDLLREFEGEGGGRSINPETDGFFSKVKEFWEDLTD